MSLVLRAIALNEEPLSQPLVGRFDERGGTLGRSDSATLTLPDPERMISRLQANVLHRDNEYWLENISAATPILHNGRALSTGMRVILREADEIRIGGYALEAAFENDDASATILRGRTVVPGLKDLPPVPRRAPPVRERTPAPRDQTEFLPEPEPEPTPAPPPARPDREPPRRAPPAPTRAAPEPPAHLASTLAEPLSGPVGSAFAEMKAQPPAHSAEAAMLWRAFLEGAGVDIAAGSVPTVQQMKSIGEMLKISVSAIQSLVTMRARAKNEMQADMTMMQPRDNNPLKFSPDPTLALQMILKPAARGFLDGPQALRDALADLQSHQVGMTAGMRSVFDAVLERLDPQKIEALPDSGSMLDKLNPGRRKARLWELYGEEYRALCEEAHDNFQRYFGEALREAYEAQVRNLGAGPEPSGSETRPGYLDPKGKPR
ncbi:MAG: type VI secretion system-associated FHA domain protein TagH [Proteobacteria bacterium]|nr:type VI secretion system-associated FHA domain protein TagH [Pseudomonadota bacterium]